jgi:hypothetical protein
MIVGLVLGAQVVGARQASAVETVELVLGSDKI